MALRLLTSLSIAYSAALIWRVEAKGGESGEVAWGRMRREKREQAGGSPHYLQEQIHNKFPHCTKPGRDD